MENTTYTISLACAKGTSQLCEIEAQQLGLTDIKTTPTLVRGQGDLTTVYQLCLWTRTASRVLVELIQAHVDCADDIYKVAKRIEWQDTFSSDSTFLVRFSGKGSGINDTQFGALTVKDAIVDCFRQAGFDRPSIDKDSPDLKIDAHLYKGKLTIALDVSGSIHQRGYRTAHGAAPIRENLAAALVMRANWLGRTALVDPVAGSGTLLIEAALLASDTAPALNRKGFGFEHWYENVPKLWERVLDDAKTRSLRGLQALDVPIVGFESDARTVDVANENIERAGLSGKITVVHRELAQFTYDDAWGENGVIVCNPPYGERLGEAKNIGALYDKLGQSFKVFPDGWRLALISGLAETPRHLHLRPEKTYSLPNGPIDSKVYLFSRDPHITKSDIERTEKEEPTELEGEVLMFANRLRKNLKTMNKELKKREINAFRLYDADIPEYGLAVDVYDDIDRGRNLNVQAYDAPDAVSESDANRRNNDAIKALTVVLDVPRHKIFLKKRERQKGASQYDRQNESKREHERDSQNRRGQLRVREGQGVFEINLSEYLDTGLFLDHRLMRERIASESKGKRVLNLFCYTSSIGVHASLGGAVKTTNVDLSQNYLDWSKRNYHLNGLAGIDDKHQFIKADVMAWIGGKEEPSNSSSKASSAKNVWGNRGRERNEFEPSTQTARIGEFDVIFCDPPTFSNTKKTGRIFGVQAAHVELIENCMAHLAKGGVLYFSNNFRKFVIDEDIKEKYDVNLLTNTIDFDFKRRSKIHRVWVIREK